MKKLFALLLVGLLLTLPVYGQEGGLLKIRVDLFSGGQNSFDDADVIEAQQGKTVKNVVLNRKGKLGKRKGQALFATDEGNTAWTGLGTFFPDVNTKEIFAASGTTVVSSDTAETDWAIRAPPTALTTGKDTEFLQCNNLLAVFNGTDNTAFWTDSIWDPGSTSTSSPPIASTGAWRLNYLFLSGNPTNTDWVYFSNNLAPQTFTSTDIIKVNSGDGQKVIRIEPFRLFELIVYKEDSIYNLDLEGTTPLTEWTVRPITTAVGCIAPRSVVNVGNDHWFVSSEPIAVRSLVRSSFDKILMDMKSLPIQDIFDGTGDIIINRAQIQKACAILFDDKYILAIPTGSSSVNNLVVVYDFFAQSWYTIDGWFPAAWVLFNKNLYYIDALDGRILQCFTGTTGDFASGPVVNTTAPPTVGIEFEYISKNFDFDNPENYKMPDALELEFDPDGNWNATISIELDDGGFQTIGTINLSGDAVVLPQTLPFTLGASGVARKTFHLQKYGEFRKIKIKIVQSGLSETVNLKRYCLFATMRQWRRED